jgi:protein-tyrosine phosphatase
VTPVLAHPERNADVQQRPELLDSIVAGGALVQVTAGSVDGRFGRRAAAAAHALIDRRLVHLLASDAHNTANRSIGMHDAVAALGDEALGHWLTDGVPRAIVEGGEVPERPEPAAPRRRFRPFG